MPGATSISTSRYAARTWIFICLLWLAPALLFSTQQWATLRSTGKEMSWLAAFLYQAPSWLLLIPASVCLLHLVRHHPLDRRHPQRILQHLVASLVFGALFLLIAVPVRHAFHPSPIRWSFFGETLFKSAPQFSVMGIGAYWLIILVGSLLETRHRLAATIETVERLAAQPPAPAATHAQPSDVWRITLHSLTGRTQLLTDRIEWIEPARTGARLHLDHDEELIVRHSLADLEDRLGPSGFIRIHRGVLVRLNAVREVRGGSSRDGVVILSSGRELPVSRRRRAELDHHLAAPCS